MKKVSFLGLPSCSWCKALREELDGRGIGYEIVNVTGDCKLADDVEALLGTENYPIVIIEDSVKTYYVFRAEHVYEAGMKEIEGGSMRFGTLTLKGLVEGVETFLNK